MAQGYGSTAKGATPEKKTKPLNVSQNNKRGSQPQAKTGKNGK